MVDLERPRDRNIVVTIYPSLTVYVFSMSPHDRLFALRISDLSPLLRVLAQAVLDTPEDYPALLDALQDDPTHGAAVRKRLASWLA